MGLHGSEGRQHQPTQRYRNTRCGTFSAAPYRGSLDLPFSCCQTRIVVQQRSKFRGESSVRHECMVRIMYTYRSDSAVLVLRNA